MAGTEGEREPLNMQGLEAFRDTTPVDSGRSSPLNVEMETVETRTIITTEVMQATRVALSTPPPENPGRQRPRRRSLPRIPTQQQLLEGAQQIWGADGFDKEQKSLGFEQVFARAFFAAPFYPIRYVQRLIQLGYEPFPPRRHFSILFQRYQYYYPGVFSYARALAGEGGWMSLYHGVGTQFVSDIVETTANNYLYPIIHSTIVKIPLPFTPRPGTGDMPDTDPNFNRSLPLILTRGTRRFLVSLLSKSVVQIIVHPFHVISIRNMAQLIGKENVYKGVWQSCREIYKTEGIGGFYSGLVPALLGHLCVALIHSSLWLLFEIIVANLTSDVSKFITWSLVAMPMMAYIPGTYSYPFFLMSNMMAVTGSNLAAATPPRVPVFTGWMHCYRHLKTTGNLYRGSAILFSRYAYKDIPATKLE
jgi:carrier protein